MLPTVCMLLYFTSSGFLGMGQTEHQELRAATSEAACYTLASKIPGSYYPNITIIHPLDEAAFEEACGPAGVDCGGISDGDITVVPPPQIRGWPQ